MVNRDAQQAEEFAGRHGASIEPTLTENLQVVGGEVICLRRRFNAFDHHGKIHRPRHGDDLWKDADRHRIRSNGSRESLVDLDGIDGKVQQIG